jgi:hypothetical protein
MGFGSVMSAAVRISPPRFNLSLLNTTDAARRAFARPSQTPLIRSDQHIIRSCERVEGMSHG